MMIELGSIPIRNKSSIVEARNKIHRLAVALNFNTVASARLATVTSEMSRLLYRNGGEPRILVELSTSTHDAGLILRFESQEKTPETGQFLLFFDDVRLSRSNQGHHELRALKRFSDANIELTETLIQSQREQIQHLSRTELTIQVQSKNRELEQHRAQLEETVAQRTAELTKQTLEATLIHRAAQLATETDSFDDALQQVVDLVCELTQWPVGHVYVPSSTTADELIPTTIWHLDNPEKYAVFREVTERTNFMVGDGLPGRILKSGEPAWIVNVQIETNFPRNQLASNLGVKGAFGFPVKISGEVVGVLEFFADEAVTPNEHLLQIMRSVGAQLGRVFERKQAAEELKQANDETHRKNEELNRTLEELTSAQSQLVQSEKMAALGQLIAGVAHEINTPLGAIRSSVGNISTVLDRLLGQLPNFFQLLSETEQKCFFELLQRSIEGTTLLSTREARRARRAMRRELDAQEIPNADTVADTLVDMGVVEDIESYFPLIVHAESQRILETAYQLSGLQRGTANITMATDRAAKVVFALKSYSHFDISDEMVKVDITEGLETVLTLYHNQLKQGVEMIRNYQEIPHIPCYPDELNQVWTNIIHNALQAMKNKGTLTLDVFQQRAHIIVSITDDGPGIPKEIQDKIFDAFFTTKPAGEGSGLGLDIVRKIIDKHQGHIEMESEPGKTTFRVYLPIQEDNSEED